MTAQFELAARKSRIASILAAQRSDEERIAEMSLVLDQRSSQTAVALKILERFWSTGDLVQLRDELGQWGRQPGFASYGGPNGQMFLNQLVGAATDPDAFSRTLGRLLRVPANEAAAGDAIRELAAFAESVKKGAHPAPRRSIFFLSFFWSLQDPKVWPCFWSSAEKMTERLGWLPREEDLGDLYVAFRSMLLELGDPIEVEFAFYWASEKRPFLGLDPTIVERCSRNVELGLAYDSGGYQSVEDEAAALANARAIVGELWLVGQALSDRVAGALGRSVKVEIPSLTWKERKYRGDGWVRWSVADDKGSPPASFRVWVTATGLFLGVHPGWYRTGWYADARKAVSGLVPEGLSIFPMRQDAERIESSSDVARDGEFLLGRFFDEVDTDADRLASTIVALASSLRPALDSLVAEFGGRVSAHSQNAVDPLQALVEEFVATRPYPSEKDTAARADRAAMAAALAADEVQVMDLAEFRRIYNGSRYGSPGPQSVLNTTMRDASPAELEEYLRRIHFLLWGDGEDADRIDELMDPDRRYIKGLGESVIMKLLAVVKPETYIPVFPYSGEQGKARMLKRLGLPQPDPSESHGRRQVQANAALRERLDPLFPNDPWGQGQFMYWLLQRPTDTEAPSQTEADSLATLADDLLVSREFIADVVELLRDRGQVVFYGPPGTGKTFIARALAKALAPDPTRRAIVQFHPSTSYEDFFEGFRPEETGGQLSYQLRKGPLALMAEKADAAPGVPHVLVIDELNRANLPKVFGELLFLLEYRDEEVRTIYRPDDAFSLPENLYFIGTMNTADRSIALVDAALRRRFHFVPFFPDDGEMAGLLRRWLERDKQPTWVADLVEMVNAELVQELGGPDLQIGPSYFMKSDVESRMPSIWRHNIEPLIQDQLFGQSDKIKEFSWKSVLTRFQKDVAVSPDAESVA